MESLFKIKASGEELLLSIQSRLQTDACVVASRTRLQDANSFGKVGQSGELLTDPARLGLLVLQQPGNGAGGVCMRVAPSATTLCAAGRR